MAEWREATLQVPMRVRDAVVRMSDEELRALAEAGDPFAQFEFGVRLAHNRDRGVEGIEWFMEAASQGSIEAAQQIAMIYLAGAGGVERDRLAAVAWLQVAQAMGDWTAMYPGYNLRREFSREELMLLDIFESELLQELNRRHVERTGQPLPYRPRPGTDQLLDPGDG
ncbi:tetratricopeptide repeat protein [Wenzhouxiangella marina]|uniref:tetratricopeptide repeat protein n=1 Tax=Wenzhouxiangella marina TaxID=1579979 RepID=UPI00067396A4|nr:sel1 repeat family protein [Wenzhouxiangella marina]MBB6088446.1 TPR repeat protein [Wenzhouxiangella marina]